MMMLNWRVCCANTILTVSEPCDAGACGICAFSSQTLGPITAPQPRSLSKSGSTPMVEESQIRPTPALDPTSFPLLPYQARSEHRSLPVPATAGVIKSGSHDCLGLKIEFFEPNSGTGSFPPL